MEVFISTIVVWPLEYAPQYFSLSQGQSLPILQNQALYSLLGTRYGGNGQTNFNLPDLRARAPIGMTGVGPYNLAQTGGAAMVTSPVNAAGIVVINTANLPAHNHTATFAPALGPTTIPISQAGNQGVNVQVQASAPSSMTPNPLTSAPFLAAAVGAGAARGPYQNIAASGQTFPLQGVTVTGSPGITANPTINTVTGGSVTVGNTGAGQALPVNVTGQVTANNMQPYLALNFLLALNGIYPSRP